MVMHGPAKVKSLQPLLYIYIHLKRLLFLWDFRHNWNKSTNFSKNPSVFNNICLTGTKLFHSDTRRDMNLILPFRGCLQKQPAIENRQISPQNRLRRPRRQKRHCSTFSLTSAIGGVGGRRHAPAALPQGNRPSTHFIGGWVGPTADMDGCGKPGPQTGFESKITLRVLTPSCGAQIHLSQECIQHAEQMRICNTSNLKNALRNLSYLTF